MHTNIIFPYEPYNFNATVTQSLRAPNQMYKKQLCHSFAHYNKYYGCHGVPNFRNTNGTDEISDLAPTAQQVFSFD